MKRLLVLFVLFCCLASCSVAEVDLSGMSRAELSALKLQVESAIQALDAQENANPEDLGIWEIAHYVDKFQMPTDEAYIRNTYLISGTFSNTATNNSKLRIRFLIDEDSVAFMLYEYGDNQVKNGYSSDNEDYNIYVLDSAGVQHKFWGYIRPNGDRIFIDDETYNLRETSADFLNILKQGGQIHFYIEESDRTSTQYNFTITDATGFAAAYEQLMGK